MTFERLDNEELLRLALDAINADRDADAISMLKEILGRDPEHTHAAYLLAAQHAQIGMFDRAETGLRKVVAQAPGFGIARFQLGQLLTMKGVADEARDTLSPLCDGRDALAAYARGMSAVAADDAQTAIRELDSGMQLTQDVPALAADMRRLRDRLMQDRPDAGVPDAMPPPTYFGGYGYPRPGGGE